MAPLISVIIPVFNNSSGLRTCLDCLSRQDIDPDSFEVIVVDNGSREKYDDLVKRFENVSLFHQPKTGSYSARNLGLTKARGAIIAFTDSDCLPRPDWLSQGVRALTSLDGPGIVGGRIVFRFRDSLRPSAAEALDSIFSFDQKMYIEKGHFCATANLFTHREVFERVGRFNEKLRSGGDSEWGNRAFDKGLRQIFAPDACIEHPARHSFAAIVRKHRRLMGGLFNRQPDRGRKLSLMYRMPVSESFMILYFWKRVVFNAPNLPAGLRVRVAGLRVLLGLLRYLELTRLVLGAEPRR